MPTRAKKDDSIVRWPNGARKLNELMQKRDIKQTELAREIGVNQALVSRWTRGIYPPKADHMLKLCAFFKVTPAELYAGIEAELPNQEEIVQLIRETIGPRVAEIVNMIKALGEELQAKVIDRIKETLGEVPTHSSPVKVASARQGKSRTVLKVDKPSKKKLSDQTPARPSTPPRH